MILEFFDTQAGSLMVVGVWTLAISVGLHIGIEWSGRVPVRDGTDSVGNGSSFRSDRSSDTVTTSAYAAACASSPSSCSAPSDGGGAC